MRLISCQRIVQSVFFALSHVPLCIYYCSVSEKSTMAQSSDSSVGVTDPEDNTPNMIVYRKVRVFLFLIISAENDQKLVII